MSQRGRSGSPVEWASDTDGLGTELLDGGRSPRTRAGARVVALTLVALAVLLGVVYVVAYVVAGDRIPRGTTVAGVKIGGLSPAAATDRLRTGLAPLAVRPIHVEYDGKVRSVTPANAGLGFDYYDTARAAGGRMSLSPQHLWSYWTGGDDVAPVVVVDDPRMQSALLGLSDGVGLPVKEGAVHFRNGKVEPVYSRPGLGLDRVAAKALLVRQFQRQASGVPVSLPVTQAQPYVTTAAVRDAVRRFGRPAMSAPVILMFGSHRVVATPKRFSAALSMIPSGTGLVPVVNGRVLIASLKPVMRQFAAKPRSASVHLAQGRPHVVPAHIGLTIDTSYLEQHFATYAARGVGHRVMRVHAVVQNPQLSTAQARRLGVRSVVASYTVHGSKVDAPTLALAARRLNDTLVRPGRTLRLVPTLGVMGSRSAPGVQSGLNRVATAFFNAGYLAGYTDTVHRTAPVHTPGRPVAREMVLTPGSDVGFTDDTAHGALLEARAHGATLTLRIWSTPTWDVRSSVGPRTGLVASPVLVSQQPGCRPRQGQPGFSVTVTRVARRAGDVQRATYAATYRPTTTLRCAGGTRP